MNRRTDPRGKTHPAPTAEGHSARHPSNRNRYLSETEKQLWSLATRDVVPLAAREPRPEPAPAPPSPPDPTTLKTATTSDSEAPPHGKPNSQTRNKPHGGHGPPSTNKSGSGRNKGEPAWLRVGQGREATPGLDRRNDERLRRGRLPIESRLDLHGMTQDQAHASLIRFVQSSASQGLRCVLVITGKGDRRKEGGGILRHAVPRWLNEPNIRPHIVAVTVAQQQHGGDGALYLYLRRKRGGS